MTRRTGLRTAALLLVVAGTATGCAQIAPQSRPAGVPRTTSSADDYAVTVAACVLSWPDVNATFRPLVGESGALVSAPSAFSAISSGFGGVRTSGSAAGQPTATLYSYSNSAYGLLRADGSVKLSYTNTPVWLFLLPLSKYIDESQGSFGAKPSDVVRSDCSYYYVVDARTGDFLTSSEECKVSDPTRPDAAPFK